MAHAAFEGEFAVVGQRQILIAGADKAYEVAGKQGGGGAAAEVDGADFAAALADSGFLGEFCDDFVGVGFALLVFPGVAVEAAEYAVVGAEGDVQVG